MNPFEEKLQEQDRFFQARKEANAKYSEISKNRFKQDSGRPFKYLVKPGNNSYLIGRVFRESYRSEPRKDPNNDDIVIWPGWECAESQDSLYNFKWKPTSQGINFDIISKHGIKQVVNHVQGHEELTTKDRLFINMRNFFETFLPDQNIFDYVPLTLVLDYMNETISDKMHEFVSIHKMIDNVIK